MNKIMELAFEAVKESDDVCEFVRGTSGECPENGISCDECIRKYFWNPLISKIKEEKSN